MKYLPEGRNGVCPVCKHELIRAAEEKRICEGVAMLCDREHNIIVDLGFMRGIIPRSEGAYSATGEVRDIAVISRVGKPVCFTVTDIVSDVSGSEYALLSRREAMRICEENYISKLRPGDVVDGRVTRPDNFGAFVDIGCGTVALIPIDAISVSRISHPSERFCTGQDIRAVVAAAENGRITLSHRELLGTWEENAAAFEAGQTVSGIVRSVERYGVFVELTPNLAGLAEPNDDIAPGCRVSVYIKSIIPEKMKIKLVIIDRLPPVPISYGFSYQDTDRIRRWRYSPPECNKLIESIYGE